MTNWAEMKKGDLFTDKICGLVFKLLRRVPAFIGEAVCCG